MKQTRESVVSRDELVNKLVAILRLDREDQEFALTFERARQILGLPLKEDVYPVLRRAEARGLFKLVSRGRGRYGTSRYRVLDREACGLAYQAFNVLVERYSSRDEGTTKTLNCGTGVMWSLKGKDLESAEGMREALERWCRASGQAFSEAALLRMAAATCKAREVARDVVRFVAAFVRKGLNYLALRHEDQARKILMVPDDPPGWPIANLLGKIRNKLGLGVPATAQQRDQVGRHVHAERLRREAKLENEAKRLAVLAKMRQAKLDATRLALGS